MSNKLSLKINQNNFSDLVNKLQDLSSIDDVIKMKIDQDNILIYSMISNESLVLALKSYLLKTKDYIQNFDKEQTYDFIITSSGKFVKNLKFFNSQNPIKLDFISKPLPEEVDVNHVRSAQFSNGKLKISCVGGEIFKIRSLNKKFLEERMNPKKCKWSFKMTQEDFLDVKKLSSINNEDRIINIIVQDGKVFVNEMAKWELEVDSIEPRNTQITFIKKYLSNINSDYPQINFHIFETFILVKDELSNLMMSFEQDFSTEEE